MPYKDPMGLTTKSSLELVFKHRSGFDLIHLLHVFQLKPLKVIIQEGHPHPSWLLVS